MRKTKPSDEPVDNAKAGRPVLNAIIEQQVMAALGQPIGLQRVYVRELWDDRYRVNVFVGPDILSATLAHSYFLVIDEAGNITGSTPNIKKLY